MADNAFAERKRKLNILKSLRSRNTRGNTVSNGDNITCPECKKAISKPALRRLLYVCPCCGYHHKIGYNVRLHEVFDNRAYTKHFTDILPGNPIDFPEYTEKLTALAEKTGLSDACVCGSGKISGYPAFCAVLDCRFLMGSMGSAVGEKIALSAEYAKNHNLPLIIFSASGGARMQEGIFSLMQMAKTSAAVKRFSDSGGLYISYLTHPTTGGVTASFASLGDIILAEPGALIGFAGPRVIEQTIKATLPEGFQRSEFLLEHGFIDEIVPRDKMKDTLAQLLSLHQKSLKG